MRANSFVVAYAVRFPICQVGYVHGPRPETFAPYRVVSKPPASRSTSGGHFNGLNHQLPLVEASGAAGGNFWRMR